jgi:hypothetical protein
LFVAVAQGSPSSRPCHLHRHGLLGDIGEPARSSQRRGAQEAAEPLL